MVAPVDISSQFIYRSQINKFIKDNGLKVDTYNIYVNEEQIYKPYTTHIYKEIPGSKKAVDDILGVDFLLSKDSDGNIVYWGWYSLSHLGGQMERINIARGIRLRKENIQIGDEEICKKFLQQLIKDSLFTILAKFTPQANILFQILVEIILERTHISMSSRSA